MIISVSTLNLLVTTAIFVTVAAVIFFIILFIKDLLRGQLW